MYFKDSFTNSILQQFYAYKFNPPSPLNFTLYCTLYWNINYSFYNDYNSQD